MNFLFLFAADPNCWKIDTGNNGAWYCDIIPYNTINTALINYGPSSHCTLCKYAVGRESVALKASFFAGKV